MNRIRVAHFDDRATAEPIRERLRRAGIPAEIHDEPWQARLWFVSRLHGGVHLDVPAELSGSAEELLLAWDAAEDLLRHAIHCPDCGSLRVDYPQFTEKSFCTNLVIGLAAGLGLLKKGCYCEHCHYLWPKSDSKPQPVRARTMPVRFMESFPHKESHVPIIVRADTSAILRQNILARLAEHNRSPAAPPARFHISKWWRKIRGRKSPPTK